MVKKTVVVAVDDSEQSMNALEWALDNIIVLYEASGIDKRLLLLHAELPASLTGPDLSKLSEIDFTKVCADLLDSETKNITSKIMSRATAICSSRNIMAEAESVEGDPRDVLCEAVKRHGADFLVVGGHGHGALKRTFFRSVSDHCVRNAQCPVLVVKKLPNGPSQD